MDYQKYILSTGTHYISNTGHDEHGQYHGGAAGDQGGEYTLRSWYRRPWTAVLRWPDTSVALKIAQLACAAALNDNIGYDQYQRHSFWKALQTVGYDPAAVNVKCETDCTASTTAIVKSAGHLLGVTALKEIDIDTYSGNMRARFTKAGFRALTASKYTGGYDYLLPGDVLLCEGHHAAINVTKGAYASLPDTALVVEMHELGDRVLKNGSKGDDVKALQDALIKLGYDLGKWGADGDFGDCTEIAVRSFQTQMDLKADGRVTEATITALTNALAAREKAPKSPRYVVITGGSCYVREAPEIDDNVIGVALEHTQLLYNGKTSDNGWHSVSFKGRSGWVSGKYGRLMK